MIPLIAGAAALFAVGKGIYDSYKSNQNAEEMQKIAKAKNPSRPSSPPPAASAPPAPVAPSGTAPISMGGPGGGMAPMPISAPAAGISMPTAPGLMAPPNPIGQNPMNPMLAMGAAMPNAGMGPNPLAVNPEQKQRNPWEQYAPMSY
jgi:hypothetical protein